MVVAAGILVGPLAGMAAAGRDDDPAGLHVRSDSAAIVALIGRASNGSPTFRRLLEAIDATDGVVYLSDLKCPDGQRACFTGVTVGGSRRNLWVRVDVKRHDDDWDVIRSIAHELRHTLEVLEVPSIASTAAMHFFYQRVGYQGGRRSYETQAAVDAGEAVRDEVRAAALRPRTK
jgi:hypothetical protein